jgi:hypothetical protein
MLWLATRERNVGVAKVHDATSRALQLDQPSQACAPGARSKRRAVSDYPVGLLRR